MWVPRLLHSTECASQSIYLKILHVNKNPDYNIILCIQLFIVSATEFLPFLND